MKPLYIQSRELEQHINLLMREHPELADDEELRLDTLEGETSLDDVLALVAEKSIEAKSMASAIKLRMDSLSERRSRFQRQDDFYRSLILRIMQAAELQKLPLPEATLSVTKGRLTVIVDDEEELPLKFQNIKVTANKKLILDELKAGRPIEGCTLSNGPPTLTIRTK